MRENPEASKAGASNCKMGTEVSADVGFPKRLGVSGARAPRRRCWLSDFDVSSAADADVKHLDQLRNDLPGLSQDFTGLAA